MKHKILVAMSGGLDSSVAAYMLVRQGYDVAGITMQLGLRPSYKKKPSVCFQHEIEDAQRVCRMLGIKHYTVNFHSEFEQKVISYFISEYAAGRTPNPCIQCNRYLKFGALLKKALSLGFGLLSTGHYAAIGSYKGQMVLKRPVDLHKDQTYFLYGISVNALSKIIFPLSGLRRENVRRIARKAGLVVTEKQHSQDICFIPDKDYPRFLALRGYRAMPGDIVDEKGGILGRHRGIIHYTIGQRSGLGVSSTQALYVQSIDAQHNRIVVCGRSGLAAEGLVAGRVNLHVSHLPTRVMAKIRYGQNAVPARAVLRNRKLFVLFSTAQESVTPGQSAAIYDGDALLGGGVIERAIREKEYGG